MLSEKVSSRFKASETHKGTKRAIKLHMILKLEYWPQAPLENFPSGQEAHGSVPCPHSILKGKFLSSFCEQENKTGGRVETESWTTLKDLAWVTNMSSPGISICLPEPQFHGSRKAAPWQTAAILPVDAPNNYIIVSPPQLQAPWGQELVSDWFTTISSEISKTSDKCSELYSKKEINK